jgi:hypothetical protein
MPAAVSRQLRTGTGGRIVAGLIALLVLAVLATAAWLSPTDQNTGTHTQLGLQPCGWLAITGKPCVTCGMTTAFARAAEGSYLGSLRAQPMGLVLCVAAAVAFWISLHTALTGGRAWIMFEHLTRPRSIWVIAAMVAAAWVYKIVVT